MDEYQVFVPKLLLGRDRRYEAAGPSLGQLLMKDEELIEAPLTLEQTLLVAASDLVDNMAVEVLWVTARELKFDIVSEDILGLGFVLGVDIDIFEGL